MKNREKLEAKLKEIERTMGGYDKQLEHLSEAELDKVLAQMEYGSCDVQVLWNNEPYVVEIYHVDDEVDFELISEENYARQYGRRVGEY